MFAYRAPAYSKPGVYFEWSNPASHFRNWRTDIAGFVGIAERGDLHTPIRVKSWPEFASIFGGHIPGGYLAYAVDGFFTNGGRTCWIVRVAGPASAWKAVLELMDDSGNPALQLTASSPGTWAKNVSVSVLRNSRSRFTLTLRMSSNEHESWQDLTLNKKDRRFVETVVNNKKYGSRIVEAEVPKGFSGEESSTILDFTGRLGGNTKNTMNGGQFRWVQDPRDRLDTLTQSHFRGLSTLSKIDEIGVIAAPDIMPKFAPAVRHREQRPECETMESDLFQESNSAANTEIPPPFDSESILLLQQALIGHCEKLKDRVAVLDVPVETLGDNSFTPQRVMNWRRNFDTSYGALYYPWIWAPDPLNLTGRLRAVPPCGHVAGVYARCDTQRGVHKPPANEILEFVQDVIEATDDSTHGLLNENDINVLRSYGGRGVRIAGARTLKKNEPAWRYVNVRRLLIMIEKAVDESTQWTVFEPNNPVLWREMDRVIRSYLAELWRKGMLDGATAEEAYFVRCDETTNPPEETENGRMICMIGVLPPWPAEFVVVRIGRTEGRTEILETSGGQNG